MKLASALCAQFASLCLVYVLSPAEYGQFALIATIAQLMFILTSGWSSGVVINIGSKSFVQTGSYKAVVVYRICIVAVTFTLVVSIFILLKPLIEGYMRISGLYVYMLLLFLGYVFYDHASQLLYPGNRDRIQAAIELGANVILFLTVAFAVKSMQNYILAYAIIAFVFSCVVSALFFRLFYEQPFRWSPKDFHAVFSYSAWQVISVGSIYIINMGTNYMLVICDVPLNQIGIYNFSYRLFSGFAPFFALFGILIPKWIHSSESGLFSVEQSIIKMVGFLAILYLTFGLALKPLFYLFHIERYLDSIPYYFWLFPSFILTSYCNLLNTVIANTSQFRRAQICILVQSSLLMIFGFPLVYLFGVEGAIIAMTLAGAIGVYYFRLTFKKALTQVGG
jgi:O-antigen/teichoic acid export membrane protein